MAKFFTGGTIWCSEGVLATSLRIDKGLIVGIDGQPQPGDEVFDLQGRFLATNPLTAKPHDVAKIKISDVYKKGESVLRKS
jgi:hypothetical protein